MIVKFEDGFAIRGSTPETLSIVGSSLVKDFGLCIADPPYGNIVDKKWDKVGTDDDQFCSWMIDWTNEVSKLCVPNSGLYVWGGIGKARDGKIPPFRPFYKYLVRVERETDYELANHITWSKKRAYGIQHNYLFTREELAYLNLGCDIKKPRVFNVPLLDVKRGYEGYDPKYPAKSEFYRRTNVWMDVTEIFRGKLHINEKPARVMEIPIEVHTNPGEWVLDPFAGSGTTALAARKLGRKFVVIEQDSETFDRMISRLRGEHVEAEQ